MTTPEPVMSPKQLSLFVSKWFLLSDGSASWVEEPRVLIIWHWFFFSTLFLFCFCFLFTPFLSPIFDRSWGAFAYRLFLTIGFVWLLILLAILATRHYRHLLVTGRDVRFESLGYFWTTWVFLHAKLYIELYLLSPSLFSTTITFIKHTVFLVPLGYLDTTRVTAYFIVYSSATAVSSSVPFLASASLLVSTLNIIEVIGSLLMTAVIVATFVNKAVIAAKD
jgi:hypothetical protein